MAPVPSYIAPITMPEYGSGTALATAGGQETGRTIDREIADANAKRDEFYRELHKMRDRAVKADLTMLGMVLAPALLPALIPAAAPAAQAAVLPAQAGGVTRGAGLAAQAALSAPEAALPGIVPSMLGGLRSAAVAVQPYAMQGASLMGSLRGEPSGPATGAASLINDIGNRGAYERAKQVSVMDRLRTIERENEWMRQAGYRR